MLLNLYLCVFFHYFFHGNLFSSGTIITCSAKYEGYFFKVY